MLTKTIGITNQPAVQVPGPMNANPVFEGVFGTLYLAVMIARLVGLNIASGMHERGTRYEHDTRR